MKKGLLCLLTVLLLAISCCMTASAQSAPPKVGVDGYEAVFEDGVATGRGWQIVYNRSADRYIMTLTEDNYTQITVHGNLVVHIPAGVTISLGANGKNYGIGVTDGSLIINGSGTLNLIGTAALYGKESSITINGTNVNASGTTYGVYIVNARLTLNGGTLTATGAKYGVSATGGVYVNGGTLHAAATKTDVTDAYGIYGKNCPLRFAAGEVTASGYYGIYNYGGAMSVSGASVTATGKESGAFLTNLASLTVSDGTASFSGGSTGLHCAENSVCTLTGGEISAKVSSGIYTNMTYGAQFDKSDLLVSGGKLRCEGYYALNFAGKSDNANADKNTSLTMTDGTLLAKGNDSGVRLYNATSDISGGVFEAGANVNAGVYVYYSTFTVNGGTVLCDGGIYGINSYSAEPVINGGTVFADGVKYGIFSFGKVTIEGGNVTAVGGTTGIAASGNYLTVGSAENARISLTAIGGSYALAGDRPGSSSLAEPGVILFGRSYSYINDLKYRVLRYVDGQEIHRSADSVVVQIDGVNVSANLQGGDVAYNTGGSAGSYKWMLRNNEGNFTLTLNGAQLNSIAVSGNLEIIAGNSSSRIVDGISVTGGVLTLGGNSSIAVETRGADAVTLTNSVLRQKSGTLDLHGPVSALGSHLFLSGMVMAQIRTDVFNLNTSDIVLSNSYISATDCASVFDMNNSDVLLYGSELLSSGGTDYAVKGANSTMTVADSKVTLSGAAGIHVYGLKATDSQFNITAEGDKGIFTRADGLQCNGCSVQVSALEEAIYTEGDANFVDTALQTVSNSGKRAVLLYAVPGSTAAIRVSGHCLIDSGKEAVRISDENGVISYFANGEIPLTTVVVSNAHNYIQSAIYEYCGQTGTKVLTCTYNNCNSTNCVATPAAMHDFSNYVSNGDATCAKDGTKTAVCPICHATETARDVGSMAHVPHVFTKYYSDKNGTCIKNATKTATCDICRTAKDTVEVPESTTDHTYETKTIVEATCQNKAELKHTCLVCGYNYTSVGETYGDHSWIADNCFSLRSCRLCNLADGAVLGHDFGEFTYDNNATCLADGTNSAQCSRCTQKVSLPATGTALGHDASDWITVTPATAYETGYAVQHCKRANCNTTLGTKVLFRVVQANADSGITIDYEQNLILGLPTDYTVQELKTKLINPAETIFANENNTRLDDKTIIYTGAIVKVTASGEVFYAVVDGDITGDGAINADDARIALRVAVKLDIANTAQKAAADTDNDGQITAADARTLLRRSVGLE